MYVTHTHTTIHAHIYTLTGVHIHTNNGVLTSRGAAEMKKKGKMTCNTENL